MSTDQNRPQFVWHEIDVLDELPRDWVKQITQLALEEHRDKIISPNSVTSRESKEVLKLPVKTVGGRTIREKLSWLDELYHTRFRELGQQFSDEPLTTAQDPRYGVNLNIQIGRKMRYECHVDSNPLEGLLYVTTHAKGDGGELVVSNRLNSKSISEVEEDCARIYPTAGTLVFFDARKHAHYVSPLSSSNAIRIVVAMNFYTPSCSEAMRPPDLNKHLGLE